eukprot:TRINITY_DN1746_c1_g1_i1.p1 TRINITY_DN1746_c1_g1~~TRINITY_DN1746_c1_g1_i1.p1  ORF type:complete len:159 (-),score=23.47 TRINITY_DN1746_c1_g1_i1:200-676(-)
MYNDEGFRFDAAFRHRFGSLLAGTLFAVAWLVWIDGAVIATHTDGYVNPPWYAYIIGVCGTVVFILMNMVSLNHMHPFALMFAHDMSAKVRAWLFVSFALGFGVLAAAIFVCVDSYGHEKGTKVWPGVALVVQNVLLLVSSVLFLFARKIDEEDDYSM